MKIYIASRWRNQQLVIELANRLEQEGFWVDAFCRTTEKRVAFHWSEFVDTEEALQEYDAISFMDDDRVQRAFQEDKKWIDWADCVIMLVPCGNSAHLEGGYAKGQGKPLFIFGEFHKGNFDVMYGFADSLFRTEEFDKLLDALKAYHGMIR